MRVGPKLALLPGSLILSYQALEEENLDQKSPGPPDWGAYAAGQLLAHPKNQEMLNSQTPSLGNQTEMDDLI